MLVLLCLDGYTGLAESLLQLSGYTKCTVNVLFFLCCKLVSFVSFWLPAV